MGHTLGYPQLISYLTEYYNMSGDRVGGVDPKEVNEAKILMHYNHKYEI